MIDLFPKYSNPSGHSGNPDNFGSAITPSFPPGDPVIVTITGGKSETIRSPRLVVRMKQDANRPVRNLLSLLSCYQIEIKAKNVQLLLLLLLLTLLLLLL